MGIPPVLKPLLPGEPRIYNPPFEQRLTEQHLLPHLTALEACFLELRTQLDPELEQALPVKLGKPYPLGQCLEISAAVFERLRSVQEHQLEPCAASGLRAIRRFQHAGGAFRAVWGDLRGRFFQNAFLLGTLYVDVSNDTVVPTKPKVEILPFHQAEFHPVRDFAHFADLARLYWGDTIYVNHVLPELAPYCPLIHVSATGAIKLHDTSQYMLSLTLRGGFEPSEHMLRAPAMPEALRQHIQRALADTPFTCAGSADAGRRQALLLCKQYRSKRRHQRRAITDALVNTVRNVNQHLAKTPYPVANNGADSAVVTAASGPHNTEPGGSAGIAHYTQTDLPAPLRLCVTTDPVPAETTDSPLNPARLLALHVAVEVFVGTDGFEIHQLNTTIAGVTQQIKLPKAAKFVDPQLGEIAFFLLANVRIACNYLDCTIDLGHDVVVQLLVGARKSPRLANIPSHALTAEQVMP